MQLTKAWMGAIVGLLIGLVLVSPPLSAQLNRIWPVQIACAAGRIIAGGTPTTCTANPTITTLTISDSVNATPGIVFSVDNTADIGASGATRPRNIYIGTSGVFGGGLFAAPGSGFTGTGQFSLYATASKQALLTDSTGVTGTEFNGGTPALGTCTGGTLTSGSHNIAGEITGNTSGSCVLNFGTPNFTNTPFCALNDETNLVAARVSARSASSITITGLTSGDAVQYICIGVIGT